MADQHTYAKLPSDPCLTQEQITAYIDGKLSAADQHACEKHLVDCAMCEDALEGLALVKDRSVLALPLTTSAVAPEETKVIPLQQPNRKKVWYAVAAVLVLVLGSTLLIKIMGESDSVGFANNEAKDVAADSISAPGEGYTLLESDKKMDSDGYIVTAADPNDSRNLRQENKPGAPKMSPVKERALGDYSNAPDQNAANELVMAEEGPMVVNDEVEQADYKTLDNVAGAVLKETENVDREQKKESFWDRTKMNLPTGNGNTEATKASEKQTLVTGNAAGNSDADDSPKDKDDNAQVDARVDAPKAVAGVPASTQTQAPVQAYDYYTDSGVVFANTVTAQDTTAVDQLEMSYINGINLLAAGQPNAAITMFEKVLLDKNHPRFEDAEFQKAKALIKANRKEEAKTLLKAIEVKKGKHAAEATELLKGL